MCDIIIRWGVYMPGLVETCVLSMGNYVRAKCLPATWVLGLHIIVYFNSMNPFECSETLSVYKQDIKEYQIRREEDL